MNFSYSLMQKAQRLLRIWWTGLVILLIGLNGVQAAQLDPALKQCIDDNMSKAGATKPQQLIKLKCHNKGIKHLKGIEVLTNLQSLSLFGNHLKHADVRSLSRLTHLNLAKNRLTTLEVEGLSELQALYAFQNKLMRIDLNGLRSLKKMRLMQNKLTALDITVLPVIEHIYLWDNQLENLSIEGLVALVFLDVKQNPMPDELYDFYDKQVGITISHDGNADDWK